MESRPLDSSTPILYREPLKHSQAEKGRKGKLAAQATFTSWKIDLPPGLGHLHSRECAVPVIWQSHSLREQYFQVTVFLCSGSGLGI